MNERQPFVSILVPARNEAKNIQRTLESLANLEYPTQQLEILVGNDNSEDETEQIISEFIQTHPHFRLISMTKSQKKVPAKAGVIAILAQGARGKFLFMTDADTELPPTWVRAMLQNFDENTGIVTGFTLVKSHQIFDKTQNLDWLIGMGLIQILSEYGLPLTAVGNNMAVRTQAYQQTGGYEKIPFSVTEDFALFQEIRKLNYSTKNLKNSETLAWTQAEKNIADLFQQRLRWAWGAVQIPMFLLPILAFYLLFGLILGLLFYINWKIALGLWILKMSVQYGMATYFMYHFKQFQLLKWIPIYEVYSLIFNIILTGFYLSSRQMKWKNQTYTNSKKTLPA